jgi:hypothetical protein
MDGIGETGDVIMYSRRALLKIEEDFAAESKKLQTPTHAAVADLFVELQATRQ